MTSATVRAGRVTALLLAVVLAAGLSGCSAVAPGADDDGDDPSVSDVADGDGANADVGDDVGAAPGACAAVFPQAIGEPSLEEVELLPTDWPEPPAGSTLCLTSTGFGDRPSETISYATDAAPEDVLAHYEGALTAFAPVREASPTGGEQLIGELDGLAFQLRPSDGSYVIVLAEL